MYKRVFFTYKQPKQMYGLRMSTFSFFSDYFKVKIENSPIYTVFNSNHTFGIYSVFFDFTFASVSC